MVGLWLGVVRPVLDVVRVFADVFLGALDLGGGARVRAEEVVRDFFEVADVVSDKVDSVNAEKEDKEKH